MQTTMRMGVRRAIVKGGPICRETVGGSSCLSSPRRRSLDGNSLESLQVKVRQVEKLSLQPPDGSQRIAGCFSARAEAGDVAFSGCLLNVPALWTQPLWGEDGVGKPQCSSVFLYSMSDIQRLPFPFQPRMDLTLVYWSDRGINPSKAFLKTASATHQINL